MNSNKLLWGRNLCALSFAICGARVSACQTHRQTQQYIVVFVVVALKLCAIFSLIEFLFCLEIPVWNFSFGIFFLLDDCGYITIDKNESTFSTFLNGIVLCRKLSRKKSIKFQILFNFFVCA